ncbi:MAG TPA: sigma-70 family RNA polymerase sigma factor [Candidatus Acidoferrales bacterium]|nr:sigma-70 family RNA polymerase sigma factor [Candidatus Acidoferrales bacterium]
MERTLTGLAPAAEAATQGIAVAEFDELVRLHQRRIYRVLLGLVRDTDAADTLTQECFLRAYRHRRRFRGESSVGTWLVRIAVNLARDHGRSRKNAFWRRLFSGSRKDSREATLSAHGESAMDEAAALAAPQATPERELAARQELDAVWAATEGLSGQQRAVFFLRFAEEMTLEEIAQATSLKLGTVKTHLHRAIGALRRRLREKDNDARPSQR